jgi:hypothetical protein
MNYCYEDIAWHNSRPLPVVQEAYAGEDIVGWYGNIEGQLNDLIDRYERAKNVPYVERLRAFYTKWRDNQITGSINRETIAPLEAAADMLAVEPWNLKTYFRSLRDQLRKLMASEEQLPRLPQAVKKGSPKRVSLGAGPQPSTSFGPSPTPAGPSGPEGAPAPSPAGGAPGADIGASPPI